MAYHTTQLVSGPYNKYANPEKLVVKANGGSVDLEVEVSDGVWVRPEGLGLPFTTNVAKLVEVAGQTIRLTPTGGASFNFGQG